LQADSHPESVNGGGRLLRGTSLFKVTVAVGLDAGSFQFKRLLFPHFNQHEVLGAVTATIYLKLEV
jgi:hypothetical protein